MKTKEELLRIYSSYLPYELKFIYSRDIPSEVNAWKLVGLIDRKDSDSDFFAKATRKDYKNQINITLSLIKPILYSMDYLTKEIEHKGERFVPIAFLMSMRSVDVNNFCCENRKQKAIDALLNDLKVTHRVAIDFFNKLLEWNFNVFNLSDSEFIKKETLNQ